MTTLTRDDGKGRCPMNLNTPWRSDVAGDIFDSTNRWLANARSECLAAEIVDRVNAFDGWQTRPRSDANSVLVERGDTEKEGAS